MTRAAAAAEEGRRGGRGGGGGKGPDGGGNEPLPRGLLLSLAVPAALLLALVASRRVLRSRPEKGAEGKGKRGKGALFASPHLDPRRCRSPAASSVPTPDPALLRRR